MSCTIIIILMIMLISLWFSLFPFMLHRPFCLFVRPADTFWSNIFKTQKSI